MSQPSSSAREHRRFVQLIVAAGLVGAVAMSLTMTNTFSAFVATITNSDDTAATGALVLQETGASGATACNSSDGPNNASTCTAFNKYGGATTMTPSNALGTTNNVSTTVNFKNTGSSTASSFTTAFGSCAQSLNGVVNNGTAIDLCAKLHVRITSGSTVIQPDVTAAALANTTVTVPSALIPAANAGSTVPFTFTTYIDNSAGNAYQGLQAAQPITWTLSS